MVKLFQILFLLVVFSITSSSCGHLNLGIGVGISVKAEDYKNIEQISEQNEIVSISANQNNYPK